MAKVACVQSFLRVASPEAWFEAVPEHIPELLIDHANCEKKAASTALSLMYRYVDQAPLLHQLSRLAREELRHFEQVLDLMQAQGVRYIQLSPARYAQGLHALVTKQEPRRLIDHLICGAVVEARSCERFMGLTRVLPEDIGGLYASLQKSEARHFENYLTAAHRLNETTQAYEDLPQRIGVFLKADADLITRTDTEFRFHSGPLG